MTDLLETMLYQNDQTTNSNEINYTVVQLNAKTNMTQTNVIQFIYFYKICKNTCYKEFSPTKNTWRYEWWYFFLFIGSNALQYGFKGNKYNKCCSTTCKQSTDLPRQLCVQLEKCVEVEVDHSCLSNHSYFYFFCMHAPCPNQQPLILISDFNNKKMNF